MKTEDENALNGRKINWLYIGIFYVIAVGIAAPFNANLLSARYISFTKGYLISDWTYLPACLGTLTAAGLLFIIDKKTIRTISFLGKNTLPNLLVAFTPILVFTLIGVENEHGKDIHYFGFVFALVSLVYAVGEEIAWRGYLQDALRPLNQNIRYVLMGIMWWAWHWRFQQFSDLTIFLAICVAAAFLIGKIAEDTKSYFCAAGLHSLVILTTNSGPLTKPKIIGLIITILIWIGIGKVKNKLVPKPLPL
jgi:hypothetical protein